MKTFIYIFICLPMYGANILYPLIKKLINYIFEDIKINETQPLPCIEADSSMNRSQNINIDPEGLHVHTEGNRELLRSFEVRRVLQSALHSDWYGQLLEETCWKTVAVIHGRNEDRCAPQLTQSQSEEQW